MTQHQNEEQWAVGVDVGGSKIAAGLVSSRGRTGPMTMVVTPAAGGSDQVLDTVSEAVGRASAPLGDSGLVGVGVGTGGVVDHINGTIVSATNLIRQWSGCRVADGLSRRLSLPVAVDNDGNTTALGEQRHGAGVGLASVLYVAVGTGIGGALVINGELIRGAHHTAGEIGHVSITGGTGTICSCGETDHLETVASGPAIAAAYAGLTLESPAPDLRDIVARARAGDSIAAEVIRAGAVALGRGLAGLVNVLDPQAVILNGGVTAIGETYLDLVEQSIRRHCLPGPAKQIAVRPGELGASASVLGAAGLVLDQITTPRLNGA